MENTLTLASETAILFQTVDLPAAELTRIDRTYKIPHVISTATYKETDDLIFYRRNLYFENLYLFFNPSTKIAVFKLNNKKTDVTNTLLKITPNRITLYQRKGKVFRQGLSCLGLFFDKALTKNTPGTFDEVLLLCFRETLNNDLKFLTEKILTTFNYPSLHNIYYKFCNGTSHYKYSPEHDLIKNHCFKQLRKCKGLNDLSLFLFRSKDKCYRNYLNAIIEKYNTNNNKLLLSLYCIYIITRYLKLTPNEVIQIPAKQIQPPSSVFGLKRYARKSKGSHKEFTHKQLKRFILNTTQTSQWGSPIADAFTTLDDLLTARSRLKKEQLEFIKSLELSIDTEHDLLSSLDRNNQQKKIYQLPHYEQFDHINNAVYDNTWQVEIADSTTDLIRWGNKNKFCIAMYDTSIIKGQCYCFGLRNINTGELYCAELYKPVLGYLQVNQLKGKHNNNAPSEVMDVVDKIRINVGIFHLTKHDLVEVVKTTNNDNQLTFENKVYRWLQDNNQQQQQLNNVVNYVLVA